MSETSTRIPGHFLVQLLESGLLPSQAQDTAALLTHQGGVTLQALSHADMSVPLAWIETMIRGVADTHPVLLAAQFGARIKVTSLGNMSLLILTGRDLRTLASLARFIPLLTDAVTLTFLENDAEGQLFIELHTGSRLLDDLLRFYAFFAFPRLLFLMSGHKVRLRAHACGQRPEGIEAITGYDDIDWQFDAPTNTVFIDHASLSLPIVHADPVAHAATLTEWEQALSHFQQQSPLPLRVQLLLAQSPQVLSLQKVADHLHLSTSTLKRQLTKEGTHFQALLDDVRKRKAIRLLSGTALSLQHIAEQLGYSDQSNFAHAFRKWTGQSPGALRKHHDH